MPTITDYPGPRKAIGVAREIDSTEIVEWCPTSDGQNPTQVHMIFRLKGIRIPMVLRFKSPDTIGLFIEQLARYRKSVWPEAESPKLP